MGALGCTQVHVNSDRGNLEAGMGFDTQPQVYVSESMFLPPEVRGMTPFARKESLSQVPEGCWLLSNHQKSSYS